MTEDEIQEFHKRYFFTGWNGNAQWILDACEALANVEDRLSKEEFDDLTVHYDKRNIQRLLRIGITEHLYDPDIRTKLPNSYATIDKLCALPRTVLYELADFDLISPSTRRIAVEEFAKGKGTLFARYLQKKGQSTNQDNVSSLSKSEPKRERFDDLSDLNLNLDPKQPK